MAGVVCDGGWWWAACSFGDGLVMTAMVLRRKICAKTLVGWGRRAEMRDGLLNSTTSLSCALEPEGLFASPDLFQW